MEKKNVLGTALKLCSLDPMTGYFRNGECDHCQSDTGNHTVCAEVKSSVLCLLGVSYQTHDHRMLQPILSYQIRSA